MSPIHGAVNEMSHEECQSNFLTCVEEIERRLSLRLKDTAKEAAENAVNHTMLILGVDVNDPLQAQKDFQTMREVGTLVMDPEYRKDLESVRTWRLRLEQIKAKSLSVIVSVVVAGILAALWIGIKEKLLGK